LLGVLAYQTNNPFEAQKLLVKAITLNPDNSSAYNNLGNALKDMNQLTDALANYNKAISLNPRFFQAYFNRGRCLQALKRHEKALASYDEAIVLKPDFPDAHDGRGNAFRNLDRLEDAIASYDKAISLNPRYAEAHNNRANALKELRRFDEARMSYERAIAVKPDFAMAYDGLGTVLAALKHLDEAMVCYDRAVALKPDFATAHYNRGNAMKELKRPNEAIVCYDKAIALAPDFAMAHNNRGNAMTELKRLDDAIACYDRAIALNPGLASPYYNRGNALRDAQRFDEALASYESALARNPRDAEVHGSRGDVLNDLRRHGEAAKAYAQALKIDPTHPFTKSLLLHQKMLSCDWDGVAALIADIDVDISNGKPSAEPFCWQGVSTSPRSLQLCSQIFNSTKFPAGAPISNAPTATGQSKIRIGYLSGEFREQATSYLLLGVLENHDKNRFDVFAFDNGWDDKSEIRSRFVRSVNEVIDISRLGDSAAAAAIRDKRIDILVNLNGYFGQHRTQVFAQRSAPIQVNYLGFPGTIGADYMDYIVADRIVIPDSHQPFYNERVVYLPNCYQANDRKKAIDDGRLSRAEWNLPEESFVFCCFNNNYKIVPDMFDCWMRILKRAPGSVLWLIGGDSAAADNLRNEARKREVEPTRLIFTTRMPLAMHLARHALADLFLDTLPYNAHTTASDALWAGLPILTQLGETFPGRVGASLLAAIGLSELVARSQKDYEDLAVELATSRDKLSAIRDKLANNRLTTPLFDTERYTRHLESAYRAMYERCQMRRPPDHIYVEP
jgi:predicted O-linked N-acetylglucosamine transferase (SPINDLY family)